MFIKVGATCQSPYQWAAKLAPPGLLIDYKNALVFISSGGWGTAGFATEEELRQEVARVLNVRVTIPESWPEFPFPAQWETHISKSKVKPSWLVVVKKSPQILSVPPRQVPRLTLEEQKTSLRKRILSSERDLRRKAIKSLQSTGSYSAQQTICFMWNLKEPNNMGKAVSGKPIRKPDWFFQSGVPRNKETICAEEVLLVTQAKQGWLFSAAYDMQNGWKSACQKGCSQLLHSLEIEDLGTALRMKANLRNGSSWSSMPQ